MDVLDLMIDASKHKWQSFPSADTDFVFVRNVQIQANIGPDAWGRDKMQPVIVSARLPFSVEKAGESDDIAHTLDYRTVYKAIRKFDAVESASAQKWDHLEQLGEKIAEDIGFTKGARIDLEAPKALLHSGGIILRLDDFPVSHERLINISHLASHRLAVKAMHIPCIIGIGEHERLQKQPVVVDFAVDADVSSKIKPFHVIYKELYEVFEKSTFLTLEAFVTAFANHVIVKAGFNKVAVSAHKPGVFGMAEGPGVQILRTKDFFGVRQMQV